MCKIVIVTLKKVPIVAVLPYKCSDLEGDFPSINEMHSGSAIINLSKNATPVSKVLRVTVEYVVIVPE